MLGRNAVCESVLIKERKKGEKNMRRMNKIMIAALATLGMLCGCTAANGDKEIKKISVVQIVSHSSLNTIRDSFTDELKELGYTDGKI